MAKLKKNKKGADLHTEIRHLGVMVEDTNKNVRMIAEQYGDITSDIDGIKSDIGGMKKTLDVHTEMIGKMAIDVEMIKSDVEFIKQGIRRKVDIEEFGALERRVALLEKRASHK